MKKTTNTHFSSALKVGTELLGEYRILKVLNVTQFGFDYLVESIDSEASNKIYLIKEFFPHTSVFRGERSQMLLRSSLTSDDLAEFNFLRKVFVGESDNLAKCSAMKHPNIINLIKYIDKINNTIYMVLSYEEGISLAEYLEKRKAEGKRELSNDAIYKIVTPLLDVLEYLCQFDIYHLDIKPENILIKEDGTPVFMDLRASTIYFDAFNKKYRNIYTDEYASPEQINIENITQIDQRSDIYSMGVLIYYLITNTSPPKAEERMKFKKEDSYISLLELEIPYAYDISLLTAVDKALRFSKKYRFKNPKDFKKALLSIKPSQQFKSNKERKKMVYLFGSLFLLLLIVYFGWGKFTEKANLTTNRKSSDIVKKNTKSIVPIKQIPIVKTTQERKKSIGDNNTSAFGKNNLEKNISKEIQSGRIKAKKSVSNELEVVNKTRIKINVQLPINIGETKIKINDQEYNNTTIEVYNGKTYKISIENPYYQPINVMREYDDLSEFPNQNFVPVLGKGKIYLSGLPKNTQIKVFESEENQSKEIYPKIEYKNEIYEVVLSSGKIFYLIFEKNKYQPYKSENLILQNGKALTLTYYLEKEIKKPVVENQIYLEKNVSEKEENIFTKRIELNEKKQIQKRIEKNITIEKINIFTQEDETQVENNDTEESNIQNSIKKDKLNKEKKSFKKKNSSKKKNSNKVKKKEKSVKSSVTGIVWYCYAKAIGSVKVSAKHTEKLTAQNKALENCAKVNNGRTGCKILNCFLLRK